MNKTTIFFLTGAILFAAMIGCSSTPKRSEDNSETASKPAFQPSYETGRGALQKMYIAARTWSLDTKPYSLQSQPTKESNGQDGKAGIWQAGFASPSKREVKLFTWSGIQSDGAPEPGINSRPADTYNPMNTSTQIFDIAFLKKDSGEAFDVAQKHGGDKILKQSPDTQIYYVLNWYGRENKLYWHVLYGDSRSPKLGVVVDASTGAFVKAEK